MDKQKAEFIKIQVRGDREDRGKWKAFCALRGENVADFVRRAIESEIAAESDRLTERSSAPCKVQS